MGATATSSNALGDSDTDTIEITGKIMVVAIIFLFVVVVFVIMLHLYAKLFWWRFNQSSTAPPPRNRRPRRRRFVFAPGEDAVIYETQQDGLDPLILKSFPVIVFQSEDFKDGLECAVCLCDVVEGEKTRLLPKCNHGFHVDCIDMWFQSHSTCPLCRNPVSISCESSKPNNTISNGEDVNVLMSSNNDLLEDENLSHVDGFESSNFPTNVLVWGNCQTQVSSFGVISLEEEGGGGNSQQQPCSSSNSSSSSTSCTASDCVNSRCHGNGMLVIDIPSEFSSSSLSPSAIRCSEDEMKSPMPTRLRSFKRLLSRDKKLSPCSPSSMDVEQGQS